MEVKIKLLGEFLKSEQEKTIGDLKEVSLQIEKLSKLPADEFALDGNFEVGATNKESILDGLKFQKAMYTGILSQTERFINVSDMSVEQINALRDSIKQVREQNKSRKEQIKEELSDALMGQKSTYHMDFCPLHGTDREWAIDSECQCPGAYIIRKRMADGMSFEDAKRYVIENEVM